MIKKLIFILITYSCILLCNQNFTFKEKLDKILDGKMYTLSNLGRDNITITFHNNKITGKATVNTYSADFNIENKNIIVTNIEKTKMNGPYNLMSVENQYFELLKNAETLNINGNILTIKTKNNKELIFKEHEQLTPNYLKGKEFVLKNELKKLNFTIGFTKDYIYGYNSIYKYFSYYTIDDGKIFIDGNINLESTENITNDIFNNIYKISLEGEKLILTTKDKKRFVCKMKF